MVISISDTNANSKSHTNSRFKIAVIDDDLTSLTVLKTLLKDQYDVSTFTSADEALPLLSDLKPGLILSDVYMPGTDGFELCRMLRRDLAMKNQHFILISSCDSVKKKLEGYAAGADDYITKPFDPSILKAKINNLVTRITRQQEQYLVYRTLADEFNRNNCLPQNLVITDTDQFNAPLGTVLGMAKLAEIRDDDIGMHLERVQKYTQLLASELSVSSEYNGYITPKYVDDIGSSSILHDIGKVGIPDAILLKPGKLTNQEFCKMKTHSEIGGDIICMSENQMDDTTFLPLGREIAYHHHEKWDGSGYPDGQKGEKIPLSARIVSIADVYDTLTSKRVYKPAITHERTKMIIKDNRGIQFDPQIVDVFMAQESKFKEISLSLS
jgi:cyclic di-GMP phosphodiesterase